jgi:hypothetical protein
MVVNGEWSMVKEISLSEIPETTTIKFFNYSANGKNGSKFHLVPGLCGNSLNYS